VGDKPEVPGDRKKKKRDPSVRSTLSDIDASTGARLSPAAASPPPPIAAEFTPITDFRQLGDAVSEIKVDIRSVKDDVASMKPKLDKAIEGIVDHRARIRASEARLKRNEDKISTLAERPHSCAQAEVIADLREGEKSTRKGIYDISQEVATAKTSLGNVTEDVTTLEDEKTAGRRWIIGLVVSVVLALALAAGGLIITVYVVQARLETTVSEQTRLRNQMDEVRIAVAKDGHRVEQAARRVETAAQTVTSNGHSKLLVAEDVWCDLTLRERNRLKRLHPSDRLPSRRCP
jgi:hypothetical protein